MTRDDRRRISSYTPPHLQIPLLRPCGILACLPLAGAARAEAAVPPAGTLERVPWLVQLIGPMPRLLWGSLLLIGALLLICIIYCVKAGGKDGR